MIFGENWSFIQTPKNASSAITDALLPYCAPVSAKKLPAGKPSKHDIPRPGEVPRMTHRLGVVRNPWDRMVSAYCYVRKALPKQWGDATFRDFALGDPWMIGRKPNLIRFQTTPQMAWLYDCNHVLRYEMLSPMFSLWSASVFGKALDLQTTNQSDRKQDHAQYYRTPNGETDLELVLTVENNFQRDIDAFGYQFEGTI